MDLGGLARATTLNRTNCPIALQSYGFMLRKTLTILSLIGLLLSVGLWGVSYSGLVYTSRKARPLVEWATAPVFPPFSVSPTGVLLEEGQPLYEYSGYELCYGGVSTWNHVATISRAPKTGWRRTRFPGLTVWLPEFGAGIVVPLWIPTLLFATLFLSCRPLHFHRRRKRKKLGFCLECGYDLRGSKDRCPECGTEIETT